MKTKDCVKVAELLKKVKVSKMEDSDKLKVVKAVKAIEKIANEFTSLSQEMSEKIKEEDHSEMEKRYQEFNSAFSGKPLSELSKENIEEMNIIQSYFDKYIKRLEEVLKEDLEKDVEGDFPKLTEDSFGKFIASNDFTMEEIFSLEALLVQ